jgi:hypothetical protein
MSFEYRITWKRVDCPIKRRRYKVEAAARRFMVLLGPEPWLAYARGRDPDGPACCSGCECGCGGITIRQRALDAREGQPPLEWMRLDRREVTATPWGPA